VNREFLNVLSKYTPLRLAVYTPASIPLSERKKVGEVIFSTLLGQKHARIPKWFEPLFTYIRNNKIFSEILELCKNNPIMSAQIAASIIQSLDKTLDELIDALKSWLEEEDDESDSIPPPSLPISGGKADDPDTHTTGGFTQSDTDVSQLASSDESSEIDNEDDAQREDLMGKEESVALKSKIEEILEGLSLLPIETLFTDLEELAEEIKSNSEDFLETALRTELEKLLNEANDWKSLYELLYAILPGLGWDYSPGFLKHNLFNKYLELSKLLEKIPQLKELANRLGRYHSLMGEKIWDPTAHGKSEVFSVERSGDIERILPGELVQLGYPTTKYLFYSKLADKSLLTYELKGEGWTQPEKEERGPVVICIDTSGSMRGLPESIAKAVSLAVAKEANSQSRKVHMILFGSRKETKDITFDKSENAVDSLLEFLNLSFGGGTDFDSALYAALTKLEDEDYKLADVLFITDGYGEIQNMEKEIEKIKKEQGTRIFTLLVESEDFNATQMISDETWILHLGQGVSPSIAHLRSKLRDSSNNI
jgi:uncharacterized protein with von Willebrand factor type A (vWA) domain